jgi:hypothetical protein
MAALRRVEVNQAGPRALGVLAPPGRRTLLILRPRALAWDLLLLRDDGSGFADLSREQAQAQAQCLLFALEDGPGGADPFEAALLADHSGCWLRVRLRNYRFLVCPRRPGEAYRPQLFADAAAAQAAADQLAPLLFPPAGAVQEVYLNVHHFSP